MAEQLLALIGKRHAGGKSRHATAEVQLWATGTFPGDAAAAGRGETKPNTVRECADG